VAQQVMLFFLRYQTIFLVLHSTHSFQKVHKIAPLDDDMGIEVPEETVLA